MRNRCPVAGCNANVDEGGICDNHHVQDDLVVVPRQPAARSIIRDDGVVSGGRCLICHATTDELGTCANKHTADQQAVHHVHTRSHR